MIKGIEMKFSFEYFLEKVGLEREERDIVAGYYLSDESFWKWENLFWNDREKCYKEIEKEEDAPLLFLVLYSKFAYEKWEWYVENGISEKIYFDTFSDLGIWAKEFREANKKIGLWEYRWLSRHLDGELFRLGRLQFEKSVFSNKEKISKLDIEEGSPIINVHIAKGEKLSMESVRESFLMAKEFWREKVPYLCHSWLLFPGLEEILGKDSNILRFQHFFRIVKVDFEIRQAEERIFGGVKERIEEYPENTSLQKRAKAYLLEGKKLGNGLGVVKWTF